MDYVAIEEGVSTSFKDEMQKVYDFLNDCETLLESCGILEKLGFDGGSISSCKSNIATTKSEITSLLSSVYNCEVELLGLDESGSRSLSEVFELSIDGDNKENVYTGEINVAPPTYIVTAPPPETPEVGEVQEIEEPPASIVPEPDEELKPYQFKESEEEAYRSGDIFAKEANSLTKFTNKILKKYDIRDKEVAQKVYEAVLVYGNEYYYEYGENPLNVKSEEEVLSGVYEILKEDFSDIPKENFWELLKDATPNNRNYTTYDNTFENIISGPSTNNEPIISNDALEEDVSSSSDIAL